MERNIFRQNNVPEEARGLIEDFLKKEQSSIKPSDRRPTEIGRNRFVPKTTKEMERYARSLGFEVTSGHGRHGKHLEAPCCGASNPLPDHTGRSLSRGVMVSFAKFFKSHERCKLAS